MNALVGIIDAIIATRCNLGGGNDGYAGFLRVILRALSRTIKYVPFL